MNHKTISPLLVFVSLAIGGVPTAPAAAPTTAPAPAGQTGSFSIDGGPVDMNLYKQVLARWGPDTGPDPFPSKGTDKKHPETPDARTQLNAWVSPNYKPDGSWGLLVIMGWSDSSGIPGGYPEICEKHRLLMVTPQNNGNEHYRTWRVAHAVIAWHEMAQRYKFNPERIYLTGGSGGGRASSLSAVLFSDIFTGAVCNCGVDCLRIGGLPKGNVDIFSTQPRFAQLAHDRSRFYLYTGSADDNHDETKQTSDWMTKNTFKHVTFFSQDGAGHGNMSNENFEKGLLALDAPLEPEAGIKLKQATGFARQGSPGQAILACQQAIAISPCSDTSNQAQTKLDELLATYQQDLEQVKAVIAAGNRLATNAAITIFAHKYAPWAKDDIAALRVAALTPARPASSP